MHSSLLAISRALWKRFGQRCEWITRTRFLQSKCKSSAFFSGIVTYVLGTCFASAIVAIGRIEYPIGMINDNVTRAGRNSSLRSNRFSVAAFCFAICARFGFFLQVSSEKYAIILNHHDSIIQVAIFYIVIEDYSSLEQLLHEISLLQLNLCAFWFLTIQNIQDALIISSYPHIFEHILEIWKVDFYRN